MKNHEVVWQDVAVRAVFDRNVFIEAVIKEAFVVAVSFDLTPQAATNAVSF